MHYFGFIFFSSGVALGIKFLSQAFNADGFSAGYVYGFILVAGSVVLVVMSGWMIVQDFRHKFGGGRRRTPPVPGGEGFVPTPRQQQIFALQNEMTEHHERAWQEFELFEVNGDAAHAKAAEESFRIAISACQRIVGKEGEVCSHSSEMMRDLASLLQTQARHEEARAVLREIVAFYQRASQGPEGGGHYWYDWKVGKDACEALAEYERAQGNEVAADALEAQGRGWVKKFALG